jgi:elongation factor G
MAVLSPSRIRNVALVGHHGAGKTTLAEALLLATGAIDRPGCVERGTTVCDFEPEETSRQLSVSMAVAPLEVDGVKVNLLDTPGYVEFAAAARTAIAAADLTVVVVSATDGVQPQTEEVWRYAEELGRARVVVVNKLDRERADFEAVLAQIRSTFGAGIAPVELPIGAEHDFRGVIDLLDDSATLYELQGSSARAGHVGPIPDELAVTEHEVHEQLVEGIVVADEDLMTRYLEGETIGRDELEATLATGVAAGAVFPVLCCSGLTGVGVDRLARLLVELGPAPDAVAPAIATAGGEPTEIPCDPAGPPLLHVLATVAEAYSGRISVCKVVSGTVRPDAVLVNTRTKSEERLHVLQTLRGKDTANASEAVAGDLVAIPRLNGTRPGDTLAPKTTPVSLLVEEPAPAAMHVAVRPASHADDDKLMSALQRLCEEDTTLSVSRDDETHQTVLGVEGEVHLAVTLERLSRKFGVTVEREPLAIAYRETITAPAQTETRYKRQTGGHGQFAVVHLRLEPLERGRGFEFRDEVVGGAIPRQYIPAVEKGVREAMEHGTIGGYPVVDVAVVCDDGKHHPVDSSEMSFKTAGSMAFRAAMEEAHPILLEPIARIEVTVPSEHQGDVLGDLSARRGRVQGTESGPNGTLIVTALVPSAELERYAVDLRALSGGRGKVVATYDHYDPAPHGVRVG